MLPISEQYLLSPCEVRSVENTLILMGYVGGFPEDGIQIESREDRLPILHCNTTVKVSVMNKALGFRVLVGRVYLSTDSLLRVVDLQNAMDYEKRNFFRVKVGTRAEAIPVPPVEEPEEASGAGSRPVEIKIRDISLSGMFFASETKMDIGDQLIVNLSLYGTKVSLLCKVVRRPSAESGAEDGYGCEFLDNSGRQFDLLCRYLFDCQREQIQLMRQRSEEARRTGETGRAGEHPAGREKQMR